MRRAAGGVSRASFLDWVFFWLQEGGLTMPLVRQFRCPIVKRTVRIGDQILSWFRSDRNGERGPSLLVPLHEYAAERTAVHIPRKNTHWAVKLSAVIPWRKYQTWRWTRRGLAGGRLASERKARRTATNRHSRFHNQFARKGFVMNLQNKKPAERGSCSHVEGHCHEDREAARQRLADLLGSLLAKEWLSPSSQIDLPTR
jgi:hypothetical protein